MSIFTSVKKRYERITPKQFIFAGVFMLALAGAIGGGFASKQYSLAAGQSDRDCDINSIDYKNNNGGCGALTRNELILDINDNDPSDLKTIYADSRFGLTADKYAEFANSAQSGVLKRDGTVIVKNSKTGENQIVMTNALTMGRTTLGMDDSIRKPIQIGGKTYYQSKPEHSFASGVTQLDVMVLFDADGVAQTVVMEACGNPVEGEKVTTRVECKGLNKIPVANKKNTYKFTTSAYKEGPVQYAKFHYYYDDGSGKKEFDTTTSPSEETEELTLTKSSTVWVEIEVNLPGGKTKTIKEEICRKQIGVVKEEFLYACDALIVTARDNTNRKFRFTAKTKQSDNVTVDSADFTLDDKTTVKSVTDKDASGNIYKDYDFADNVEHKVSVVVNFTAEGKKVTSKVGDCVAKVTPEKAPECKPDIPVGDSRCEPLPKTGAGGVAGLFAGITAAGAIGHRMYMSRKSRRS